jgi:penicillin-binding protein 1C
MPALSRGGWIGRPGGAHGEQPWTFLVDGGPLPQEIARRDATWRPPGPGIYRVSVIDAGGDAAGATIRIRAE